MPPAIGAGGMHLLQARHSSLRGARTLPEQRDGRANWGFPPRALLCQQGR